MYIEPDGNKMEESPTHKIIIPGDPIPQMRPRFFMRNGVPSVFDPQTKEKAKVRAFMQWWIKSNRLEKAISLAQNQSIEVGLWVYSPIPKSASKTASNQMLWDAHPQTHKPDLDNIEKFYLDCCKGIFWYDDSQVTKLSSQKRYSQNARVEIQFRDTTPNLSPNAKAVSMHLNPDELRSMLNDMQKLGGCHVPDNCRDPQFQLVATILIEFAKRHAAPLQKICKQISVSK